MDTETQARSLLPVHNSIEARSLRFIHRTDISSHVAAHEFFGFPWVAAGDGIRNFAMSQNRFFPDLDRRHRAELEDDGLHGQTCSQHIEDGVATHLGHGLVE